MSLALSWYFEETTRIRAKNLIPLYLGDIAGVPRNHEAR